MAFHLYEDTWETSITTGTGAYTLAGAVTGWRAFSAQYANADTCWYSAYDGTNFEQGIGTYNSGANTLSRTTIYRSTNGGSAVSWTAGTRNIVVSPIGVAIESLFTLSSTGIPNRTADNTWAYLPYATGTWTPADGSGASLTFTSVSAAYTRIGNMVFAYATLTYPVTANGSNAVISGLPFALANASYARVGNVTLSTASITLFLFPVLNATTIPIFKTLGNAALNSDLSSAQLNFELIYPVT